METSEQVGQVLVGDEIHWHRSIRGPQGAIEEDGSGVTPQDIRERLMEEEGRWMVKVDSSGPKVGQVLRTALGITLSDAGSVMRHLPGIVYSGTRVESEWLVGQFSKAGLRAAAVREQT